MVNASELSGHIEKSKGQNMVRVTALLHNNEEGTTTAQSAIITVDSELHALMRGPTITSVDLINPENDKEKTIEAVQAWLCAIVSQAVNQQIEKPHLKAKQHDNYCAEINKAIEKYNIKINEIVTVDGNVWIEHTVLIPSIVAVCTTTE